jgi:hypothetical protein
MAGDLAFVVFAVNPVGGILVAIPFAMLKLGYPAWLAVAASVPLAYVQVIVVDLGWDRLLRSRLFLRCLERQRSPRTERLMASGGAFWSTLVFSPLLGPWVVMAFMRYAQVPQRRIALPVFLAILGTALAVAISCALVPRWFQ